MTRALLAIVCVWAAACAQPEPSQVPRSGAAASPPAWHVTKDGAGPLRIDMTLLEVEQAMGQTPGPPGSGDCEQRRLKAGGGSVLAMFVDHRLARIDVTEPGVATDAGVVVGSPAAMVRDVYGAAVVAEPHKYTYETGGQYLTVPVSNTRVLIFETDGSAVTTYRLGRLPEVEWVEGCA